ncbi:unnamed protein product [Gulo gulo]|uniref:Uncharacterized protein n=1 Tax=Gulo gulo TaxID=48420 RepID=A0A9X9LHV7_GULGU|nr:unnamed protein product [Gulo gulo]
MGVLTVPSSLAQPIKMSSLTQQLPGLFKALGQGMGVVLPWLDPCPPGPSVSFLRYFHASAPDGQCDGLSPTPFWPTGVSGPVGFLGVGSALPHSFSYLLPPAPLQPPKGFGFLTTVEGVLRCLQTQPHSSFHDIMSRGGGNIKGQEITFYQDLESMCDQVPLPLRGWPWLYDLCGSVTTSCEEVAPVSPFRTLSSFIEGTTHFLCSESVPVPPLPST